MASDDSSYVISTGTTALDRLQLLARLFWPTTEQFLARSGAYGADRVVEIGCGIGHVTRELAARGRGDVVGIDINPDVVEAARRVAPASTARFRTASVDDLGSSDELSPDVLYTRCVVGHLQDPQAALDAIVRAVRPGGSILVEDVEVAAVWSSPPFDPLRRHVELYVAAAFGLGARPDIGAELAPMLAGAGAEVDTVDVVQPVLRRPADLQIHARTMEAIAEPVISQGLATAAEVGELVDALDVWAQEPGVVATLPRIVQVHARVPVS